MHKMFGLNFVRSSLDRIIHRVSPGPVSIDQDQKFPPLPLTAHSPPRYQGSVPTVRGVPSPLHSATGILPC